LAKFGQFRHNFSQLAPNFGQFRHNFGQFRHNFGQFRHNFSHFKHNFGQFRHNFDQFRHNFGKLSVNFGQFRHNCGPISPIMRNLYPIKASLYHVRPAAYFHILKFQNNYLLTFFSPAIIKDTSAYWSILAAKTLPPNVPIKRVAFW